MTGGASPARPTRCGTARGGIGSARSCTAARPRPGARTPPIPAAGGRDRRQRRAASALTAARRTGSSPCAARPGSARRAGRRLAQAVDQIARVGSPAARRAGAEQREMGRPRLRLGHVADLDPAARDRRRRVASSASASQRLSRGGRDAAVPDLVGLNQASISRSRPCAGQAESGTSGAPRSWGRSRVRRLAQLASAPWPVVDEVPFVEADDQRPALAARRGRRACRSCFSNGMRRIEEQRPRPRRSAPRAARRRRKASRASPRRARACGAGRRCRRASRLAAPGPVDRDRVAGDAGLRAGEQAVLAEQALISVDLPALGRPTTATRSGFARRLRRPRPLRRPRRPGALRRGASAS